MAELTRLCGYLPLAIGMVARQLHHHPAWSASWRAAELAAAVDRLELMATENLSVAAAFNLSYDELAPDQQRLFRRLGLHPGTDIDIDAYAAAAVDGTSLGTARRGLETLYDQYLIAEPAQGRYRMHDLIREHAHALAVRLDPDRDRDQATARLLDYYQYTAGLAEARLASQSRLASAVGPVPAAAPVLADFEQALTWVRAERASLLACLDQVTGTGQHARIIALTAGVAGLLHQDGPWAEAIARHETAVRAAQHLGDRLGQANALGYLGLVRLLDGDYPAAARALEEELGLAHDLADCLAQANALHVLGDVRRLTGDYPGAARDLEQALGIYRDIGDRLGVAETLNEAGTLHRARGDLRQARSCHQQALDLAREIGSSRDEAHALAGLGRCALAAGPTAEAKDRLRQALEIFQRIGAAEAAEVSAEVQALTDARPTPQGS